jgi:molecular chaperone GrpE (heat shock protein)
MFHNFGVKLPFFLVPIREFEKEFTMSEEQPKPATNSAQERKAALQKAMEENTALKARLEAKGVTLLNQSKEIEGLNQRLKALMDSVAVPAQRSIAWKTWAFALALLPLGYFAGGFSRKPPPPVEPTKVEIAVPAPVPNTDLLIRFEESQKQINKLSKDLEDTQTAFKASEAKSASLALTLQSQEEKAKLRAAPPLEPLKTEPPKVEMPKLTTQQRVVCNARVSYVNLRNGPDADDFDTLTQLDNHTKVQILGTVNNPHTGKAWHRVQVIGEKRNLWGFVDAQFLKEGC